MNKRHYLFLALLGLTLAIAFGLHTLSLFWLQKPLLADKIVLSYVLNFALAVILFIIVQLSVTRKSTATGFVFMAGSLFKFLIFFLVFYPTYKADGTMAGTEFAAFFIPYALCLIAEVIYLSKQLNNQTYSTESSEEKKQIK